MPATENLAVVTLLLRCQQVETAMAQVYERLATTHAYDPEMSTLWRKTAKEEENHGMQFQLARNLSRDAIKDPRVDVLRVERTLAVVRAYLTRIQTTPPGIEDALDETIAMEQDMVDLHANSVVRFDKEAHRKLFGAMMAADKGHVAALQAALARVRARKR